MLSHLSRAGSLDGCGDHNYFPRNPRGRYIVIRRAEGVYLYDQDDKPILDGASGAAVVCLGHGNQRVIRRMAAQAEDVAFAHTSAFVTRPVIELAERLAERVGDPRCRVYFVSGGSEATETALKIARAYHVAAGRPTRYNVISRSISYHGASLGALAVTGVLKRRQMYEPLLVQHPRISLCHCTRCPFHLDPDRCELECASDLERAILAYGADRIAAFIVEPVIGASAPAVVARAEYMQRIAATCKKHRVLLIADEIMSGTGRTGRFLAMEHYGVRPDITILSKGISSGYAPLAAVVVSADVFETIANGDSGEFVHGFTYSGNPLSAAVGLEVLDILEEEQLVRQAARRGEVLLNGLQSLRSSRIVGEIRGKGLLLGVEFMAHPETSRPFPRQLQVSKIIAKACLDERLAVYPGSGAIDGLIGDHIMLAPPYIITELQIAELVEKLGRAVGRVERQLDEGGALDSLETAPSHPPAMPG